MERGGGGEDHFNSAFLFAPDGGFAASYKKQRLVIFGEYVPLQRWLPFTKYLTPIQGSYTPGPGPARFVLTDTGVSFSPLICFEDGFGRSARHHVEPDTDFLLNLTNDGWFGESSAQWQQAAQAVFRAVENRRPLVRCTNNGLTCWVDACGRVREILGEPGGSVYAPGFLTVRLPLAPAGTPQPMTWYRRHGDRFGWGCVGWIGLVLVARRAWQARVSP
jgi:apolipoprotein N-acyltransferase